MWMEKGRNKHAINSLCVYKKNQQHMQVTQHLRYKFVLEKTILPISAYMDMYSFIFTLKQGSHLSQES